jgi:hypothetical protein
MKNVGDCSGWNEFIETLRQAVKISSEKIDALWEKADDTFGPKEGGWAAVDYIDSL